MTARALLAFFACVLLATAAAAEEPAGQAGTQAAEQAATQAAEAWLKLVDAGSYAESWKTAASFFKGAVTAQQWAEAAGGVRAPLGKLVSRKLKSSTRTKTLPGAPDGDYLVIQYDASFEHKKAAVETITPMVDKDGQWRVSGYFIR